MLQQHPGFAYPPLWNSSPMQARLRNRPESANYVDIRFFGRILRGFNRWMSLNSCALFAHCGEVDVAGVVEIFAGKSRLGLQELAEVDDLIDDVARVAAAHVSTPAPVLSFDQVIDGLFVVWHANTLAVLQEDPFEFFFGWACDVDFEWNTS